MKLVGTQQARAGPGAHRPGCWSGPWRLCVRAALISSQASFWPCGSRGGVVVAKDMRMAADHLGGDGLDHIAEVEQAGFLGHAGMKHDLEQKIAQFVGQGLVSRGPRWLAATS